MTTHGRRRKEEQEQQEQGLKSAGIGGGALLVLHCNQCQHAPATHN